MPTRRQHFLPIWSLAWAILAGCARDPLDSLCPSVAQGELVVSELRGEQDGADTFGQWIELYNDTSADVALYGMKLVIYKPDGSDEATILVRDESLNVLANDYVVLGRAQPGAEPDHVDYGFAVDFDKSLYDSAVLEVWACEELIDTVSFADLPGTGSLGFDGALAPDAETNDDTAAWCNDSTSGDDPEQGVLGAPGTPGERNLECP